MGILNRFKDIMASNVNALLDKVEDPEKMIDQTLRNLNKDLSKVTSETASVMAEEKRAKRVYTACAEEVAKLQEYAVKALTAGNEEDAKKFLESKLSKETELATLDTAYQVATLNATNMRAMHTKLQSDVKALEAKKAQLKAKFAAAKTQEKINKMINNTTDSASSISAFERYEEKANKAFDKATAMTELNATGGDKVNDLKNKYDSSSSSVDAELEKLKASLGQ